MSVIPLFTSAYSFRSILTFDKPEDVEEGGADSIIAICKTEGLKNIFVVEDNMVGYLEAKKNSKGMNFEFGLRLTFCSDINDKSDESKKTEHKLVIFMRNDAGYFRLVKIFSKAGIDGYLDGPRMDMKTLLDYWSDEDLLLVAPFYDSFIHKNISTLSSCIPDFTTIRPIFFKEDSGLYIDELISEAIDEYNKDKNLPVFKARSIYYYKKRDFITWMTYKCIKRESTIRVPNMTHCSSDMFSFEAWKEQNAQ